MTPGQAVLDLLTRARIPVSAYLADCLAAAAIEASPELQRLRARVAELEGQQTKQYGSYLRCRGYADCSADQRLAGCPECERVK